LQRASAFDGEASWLLGAGRFTQCTLREIVEVGLWGACFTETRRERILRLIEVMRPLCVNIAFGRPRAALALPVSENRVCRMREYTRMGLKSGPPTDWILCDELVQSWG